MTKAVVKKIRLPGELLKALKNKAVEERKSHEKTLQDHSRFAGFASGATP